MPRISYVNGRYIRHADALVHIEDRGLLFADSVYEVCAIRSGVLIDLERHLNRLQRSLDELEMYPPVAPSVLPVIIREVVARERIVDGAVYVQVTRGVAPRNHAIPEPSPRPGLIVTARPIDLAALRERQSRGVDVVTVPENRWARADIKTTSLIANVMAKQEAVRAGAAEAWYVDGEGRITEGSSSNAWIVTEDSRLITRQADRHILRGITRDVAIEAALAGKYELEERPFSRDEALSAREAFLTSTSNEVMPVIAIDGISIGDGRPGPVASTLAELYLTVAVWDQSG